MLFSETEVKNQKLKSVKVADLRELALASGFSAKGAGSELVKTLINIPMSEIDHFIKAKYKLLVEERQKLIADDELIKEVQKVTNFNWGVVQGQLDQKIQSEYVRKFYRFADLINGVESNLHDDITSYVVATWYNHWTTVLIEDHISLHPRVIPTLKNTSGVDIFFDGQPFDLKTTYLPRNYPVDVDEAIKNPRDLAIWMYENQGEQRFGAGNRLFLTLVDKGNLEQSWKLKRDFEFVFREIDSFFNDATVTNEDEIVFKFKQNSYTTIAKVLLIAK